MTDVSLQTSYFSAPPPGRAAVTNTDMLDVDPITNPLWRSLVAETPSSVFHTPEWLQVIANTYGFSFVARVLVEDGRPVAGVAWSELHDILGRRRVSLPFCDYADVLSARPEHTLALMRSVIGNGREWTLRTLRENLPAGNPEAASTGVAKWMGIDITGSDDDVMGRIDAAARKGIRKAEKRGITTRLATDRRDLRQWFEIHLGVRKRKHELLAQPFAFFEAIWDAFIARGQGFLVLTVFEDEVIGGMFCLQMDDVCYTKFSASKSEFNVHKPNNLLQWATMAEARRRGCRLLDMGRNPLSAEGLIYFKETFGAFSKDLLAVTYRPPGPPRQSIAEHRALLGRLTATLVAENIPDSVTEQGGNILYRYFA